MVDKLLRTVLLISAINLPASASALADWPVAIVDEVVVHPNQVSIPIDPLGNDIGEDLEIVSVNEWSENGAKVFSSQYVITYQPPQNFTGEDGFWYVIRDAQGRRNAARVSVNVLRVNSALPAPQEDRVKIPIDTPIRINVTKNDLFSTRRLDGQPTGGGSITQFNEWSEKGGRIEKVLIYPGGAETFKFQLRYTPPSGFTGTDTFWYVVKDFRSELNGTVEQAAKVTIEVSKQTNIQAPFPIANPETVDFFCFRSCRLQNVFALRNDKGNNLILKLNSPWSQNGGRVIATPEIIAGGASLEYIPKDGFTGEDKVWYVIEDEYGRENWSVLTVNVTRDN